MRIVLGVDDWEHTPLVAVDELIRRLLARYPTMMVDRAKGDEYVQKGLERLVKLGGNKVLQDAHRSYFGDTVFVSISEESWDGATASAYLTSIRPPLGDAVYFDLTEADSHAFELIKRGLEESLEMVICPQD